MEEIKLILPKRHEAQEKVWREKRRFNVVTCGRRWGKTALGVDLCIASALDGQPVAWGAPHYKYLSEPQREIARYLAPIITRKSEAERRLELQTGGSIDFWTLEDQDAGRGRKYGLWVIDEAASVKNLDSIFWESIRPTLTDLRGSAWFLGTPHGRDFFWQAYCKGEDPAEREWMSWQMPSAENPLLAKEEIFAAEQSLPATVFRQEYLAEFLDGDAAVFGQFRSSIDVGRSENEPPQKQNSYRLGVDLARKSDFTVVTVVDQAGRQVYFERWRGRGWESQIQRVAGVAHQFSCPAIVDATGLGDVVVDRLHQLGVAVIPYIFTARSRTSLLDNLTLCFEQGTIRLMDIATQTQELASFIYEMGSGAVRAVASGGGHDDCVMALALALSGTSSYAVAIG